MPVLLGGLKVGETLSVIGAVVGTGGFSAKYPWFKELDRRDDIISIRRIYVGFRGFSSIITLYGYCIT